MMAANPLSDIRIARALAAQRPRCRPWSDYNRADAIDFLLTSVSALLPVSKGIDVWPIAHRQSAGAATAAAEEEPHSRAQAAFLLGWRLTSDQQRQHARE